MGVLNVTPDSFYDGGKLFANNKLNISKALSVAEKLVNEGASFIDVGGESTRPGAAKISLAEESERVLPVVEKLVANIDAVISVDTSTTQIISEAASLGAGLINDVRALEKKGALQAAVQSGLPVCFMHMQGTPQTMQANPQYSDIVDEVKAYLESRIQEFMQAGGKRENIIIDPGFGFGKTDTHNLDLLKSLARFGELGAPILVGLSRKSMIGRLLNREVDDRLAGSLALALAAAKRGANIIRVHDVQATSDVLKLFKMIGEF
jgi:dihydropteroate synthase